MTFRIEDFGWAVVRLATLQKKGIAGRLLFATVTLLTHGRRSPPRMSLDMHRLKSQEGTVYFRRVTMTVPGALEWYRALQPGSARTPVPARAEDVLNIDGVAIEVGEFSDDPVWPHLGLPMGDSIFAQPSGREDPAPFVGSVPSRVHRRFGDKTDFGPLLADSAAVEFAARRLHVDLREYPEYLGSVALVVPDPVLQRVENFLIPASPTKGERIFYRFVPRRGANLAGLGLTTFDEEAHLLTGFESYSIGEDGILEVEKSAVSGAYGYVVTHPNHGVLMYHPPTPFLRMATMNMEVSSFTGRTISVPQGDAKNSPNIVYVVPGIRRPATQRIFGEPHSRHSVNARVGTASAARLQVARAKAAGQRWFPIGAREEAMRFVQYEIGRARARIMIVDPYFSGLQVLQFLYAAGAEGLQVTLVTSGNAFKKTKERSRADIVQDFTRRLEELKEVAGVSPEVYVLSPSALHDRFLVIDDTVWFLGNSLNALAEKASLVVKVPDPEQIVRTIDAMLASADTLAEYSGAGEDRNGETGE